MSNKWKVSAELLSSTIDDEVVLMSIKEGFYYSLEPVASRIWTLLSDKPASIEELTDILTEEYEVDRETCLNDVRGFIEDMFSNKLILPA